jgi:hypothetical protein
LPDPIRSVPIYDLRPFLAKVVLGAISNVFTTAENAFSAPFHASVAAVRIGSSMIYLFAWEAGSSLVLVRSMVVEVRINQW